MEEKIVIDKPDSVNGLQLILISKVTTSSKANKIGMGFFARKQPVAVILDAFKKRRAFKITGEEVLLEELTTQFPSLVDYV